MRYEEFTPSIEVFTKEIENDRFKLSHIELSASFVENEKRTSWRTSGGMKEVSGLEAGSYVVLRDKKLRDIIMSDTWMEQHTNIDFVRRANGNVLVAGLGIGMIILAIQDKPDIKSVTIVDLHQGIYDIIMPTLSKHLNNKVKVVICDIHDFVPEIKYDVIYCDIWNDVSGGNWDEMKKLTKKFKHKIDRGNPEAFIDHWRKEDTIRMSR